MVIETHREFYVMAETEIGFTLTQVKECQELLVNHQKLGERHGTDPFL